MSLSYRNEKSEKKSTGDDMGTDVRVGAKKEVYQSELYRQA